MDEKTKTKETKTAQQGNAVPDPEELVTYDAPLDPRGESRDITVGVNGEFIKIKRGETVQIKRKFFEAIMNANRQELVAVAAKAKAVAEAGKATAEL